MTEALINAAVEKGAELRIGTVGGVRMEGDRVAAVLVDGQDVPCEKVCAREGM